MLTDPTVRESIELLSGWFTREQAFGILTELYSNLLAIPNRPRYELTSRVLERVVNDHQVFLNRIENRDRQGTLQRVANKKVKERTEREHQVYESLWHERAQQSQEEANLLLGMAQQNQRPIQRPATGQASLEDANLLLGMVQPDQEHIRQAAAVRAPFHPVAQQNQQQIQQQATVQAPSDPIAHTTEPFSTMAMTATEASRTIDPRVPGLLERPMQRRITDLTLSRGRSPSPQGRSSRVTPQRHVPTREPSPSHPLPETLDGDQIDQRQAAGTRFFADAVHGTGASTHTSEHSSRSSAARGSTPPKGDQ